MSSQRTVVLTSPTATPLQKPLIVSYYIACPLVQPICRVQGTSASVYSTICLIVYLVQGGTVTTSFCLCPTLKVSMVPNLKVSTLSSLLPQVNSDFSVLASLIDTRKGIPILDFVVKDCENILETNVPLSQPLVFSQILANYFYRDIDIYFVIVVNPQFQTMMFSIWLGTVLKSFGNWQLKVKAKMQGTAAIYMARPYICPFVILALKPKAKSPLATGSRQLPQPSNTRTYFVSLEFLMLRQRRINPAIPSRSVSFVLQPYTYIFSGHICISILYGYPLLSSRIIVLCQF